jgi:hypothetical protein
VKTDVNLSDDCKIIINCVQASSRYEANMLFGKEFNVGHNFYALEEYDKESLNKLLAMNKVWPDLSEAIDAIKYDENGHIYLRLPNDNERKGDLSADNLVNRLSSQINQSDMDRILEIKPNNLLPYIEKYNKSEIENSSNMSSNMNEIRDMNYKEGEYIYKLRKISKYFLSSFKGISENRLFVYKNNYTSALHETRVQSYGFDKLFKTKFKPIQENQFNVYDFSEINTNTLENADNYQWKIMIKFVNDLEMRTFIHYLQNLRRRVNVSLMNKEIYIERPIDKYLLTTASKPLTSNFRTLRITVDKIEFRQGFNLKENKKLSMRIGTSSQGNKSTRYMLEALQERDFEYTNEFAHEPMIAEEIKRLKGLKGDYKYLPKEYELNSSTFNSSQKIVTFGNINDSKQVEMEVKQGSFILDVVLKGQKHEEVILSDDIKIPQNADMIYVPLYFNDGTFTKVVAIGLINVWTVRPGDNRSFEELLESHINTLEKVPKDEFKNFVKMGKYEPNVYKRRILKKINQAMKSNIYNIDLNSLENREKLHHILRNKCVKGAEYLLTDQWMARSEWRDLVIDMNLLRQKIFKKFYFQKKRNEFYKIFSKCEWFNYLNKIPTKDSNQEIYSKFPSLNELKKIKTTLNSPYISTKYLFYLGVPHEKRLNIWEKLLNTQVLAEITQKMLYERKNVAIDGGYSLNRDIYNYFRDLVKENVYHATFSLIDSDMNLMTNITDFESPLHEMKNLTSIKHIAKAFFLWSDLDITTDTFIQGENKKFVYFNGILRIIQRLFSVFQDESTTFWLLVGLSQVVELFYQTNPLYSTTLSYTKIYVLITKLIMQHHLKSMYNKFIELNFPIEFFIDKLIPTLYADYLQTELFLRLLDITIFEAAVKNFDDDRYHYLRVICTIPITLMKLNERKIMECKTVREMETIFSDLISKSFNNEKFIQLVKENVDSFYNTNNIIETFIDYNQNTTWDFKRAKIESKLDKFFTKVESENNVFLKKFAESKTSLGHYGIEIISDNLKHKLYNVRNVYTTGTPGFNNTQQDPYGIVYTFPSFTDVSGTLSKYMNDMSIYVEYSSLAINHQSHNYKMGSPELNCNFKQARKHQFKEHIFGDKFAKYMNIFLYSKGNFVGSYLLDIRKLEIMKPYKIKLESTNPTQKSVLEIAVFKWSKENLREEESVLYNYFFSEPTYQFDGSLDNAIHGFEKSNQSDIIKKFLINENEHILKPLNKLDQFSFMVEEFKKNSLSISHKVLMNSRTAGGEDHVSNILNSFFANVFDNKEVAHLFSDWTKNSDSSFEEVLYAACLVDPSTITIYEKLKLIFDIAKMRSFIIYNDDSITVHKLKELIYSLYKRYMVYFTKADVDRIVDYILTRESIPNFKHALVYDTKSHDLVLDLLSECDNINTKDIKNILKMDHTHNIVDVRKNLTRLINMLINNFNVNRISANMLNASLDFLVGHQVKGEIYKSLKIDFNNENTRKIKEYEIAHVDNDHYKLINQHNEDFEFSDGNYLRQLFEMVLAREINSYELYANENIEISFDKFKDIFFELPFIPDLLRATCCFTNSTKDNFIKSFDKVSVEVYGDRSNTKHFIFTNKKVNNFINI